MEKALLTPQEIALARHCLEYARSQGADAVRITLTKSLLNLVGVLNGEVDKTSHALDRSLQLQLFAKGRFGSFSSNRLDKEGLEAFIREALDTVGMLEADSWPRMPSRDRNWACTTPPARPLPPKPAGRWPLALWHGPRKV